MLSHWLFLRLSGTKSLASPGHSDCQINHTSVPAPAKATQGVSPRARRTPCRAQEGHGAKCYMPCVDPVWKTSNTSKLEQTWVIKRKSQWEETTHLQCILPSNGFRDHQEAQSEMSSCNSAGRADFPLVPTSSQNVNPRIMRDRLEVNLRDLLSTLWANCHTTSVFSNRYYSYFFGFFKCTNGGLQICSRHSIQYCFSSLSIKTESFLLRKFRVPSKEQSWTWILDYYFPFYCSFA